MNETVYTFHAAIEPVPDKHGAFVRFPHDIRAVFGKGRVKVRATFDGEIYDGSLVNMADGAYSDNTDALLSGCCAHP